jgi:Zn-dependent M28 family amino/carboxypeptidase
MKKLFSIFLFCAFYSYVQSQPVEKFIQEKNITRIIRTLSADNMMGRPAAKPELIEPAARFIESEFKKAKLQFLPGLNSYRQTFTKTRITGVNARLTINGNSIPAEDILVLSEQKTISNTGSWKILSLQAEKPEQERQREFAQKFRAFSRDTTSALIIVDKAFREYFKMYQGFLRNRFTSGQSATKVFAIAQATLESEQIPMSNIVGVLPGKSKPEESVIFSAHYDHIGIQKTVSGDSIANGADDDASGTTAVIELARYFSKIKSNERTLIFVAFTAEEIGGFGSQYFSVQMDPLKTMAMFNIEMIGKVSKFGTNTAWITGYERSDFGEILQKNLQGTPFQFKPDPYPEQNLFYRSDNATLARMGIPAHSISTDQIDIDKLYHSVDDEFESMDIQNITSTIRAIALSAKSIVSGRETPRRIDPATVN